MAWELDGVPTLLEAVTDVLSQKPALQHKEKVVIGATPQVLLNLGVKALDIITSVAVVEKAIFEHHLSGAQVLAVPQLIQNPVMIFRSDTTPGTYILIVDLFNTSQNYPVVVAFHPSKLVERAEVNFIPSVHDRRNVQGIKNWMSKGLLVWQDQQKSPAWTTTAGLC